MPRLLVQREACRVVTRTFGIWYPQAATPPKASDSVRCRSLRLPPLGCAAVAVCPPARSPRPPAAGRAADRGGLRAAWSAAASVVKVYPELRGARALPGRPYAEASGRPGVIFPQHDRSTPKSGPRARGAQGAWAPNAAPGRGAPRGPTIQTRPPRTELRAGRRSRRGPRARGCARATQLLQKRRPGRHNGVRVPQPGANHRSAPPTLKILSPLGFTKPPVPQNAVAYRVFREPVPDSRFLRCPPARDLPPSSIPDTPEIIPGHPRPLPGPLRPLRTLKTRNSIIPTTKCHFGSQATPEFPPTKVLNPAACNCHFGASHRVNSLPC